MNLHIVSRLAYSIFKDLKVLEKNKSNLQYLAKFFIVISPPLNAEYFSSLKRLFHLLIKVSTPRIYNSFHYYHSILGLKLI